MLQKPGGEENFREQTAVLNWGYNTQGVFRAVNYSIGYCNGRYLLLYIC